MASCGGDEAPFRARQAIVNGAKQGAVARARATVGLFVTVRKQTWSGCDEGSTVETRDSHVGIVLVACQWK